MRDYNVAVADLLMPLMGEAKADGDAEYAMYKLRDALYIFAEKVEWERDRLTVCTRWHCRDCDRYWSVTITVKQERERFDPINCPACWNASRTPGQLAEDGPSRWTDYRYVEAGGAGHACDHNSEREYPCKHDVALAWSKPAEVT